MSGKVGVGDTASATLKKKAAPKKPKAKEQKEEPEKPAVWPYCQKDMLAIVGTAPTMPEAPYENDDFEIWSVAVSCGYPAFKRWDLLWELHSEGYYKDPRVLTRINKETNGKPIAMREVDPDIPTSVRFPIEEILPYRRYHTTSITYMLAWALHSRLKTGSPKHVALFGIHMESREEYTTQRPCCEYWLARLEQAGVDVFIAGGAILVADGLYGYEKYDAACWKIRDRLNQLTNGLKQRAEQESNAELLKNQQMGAIKEAEYWLRLAQTGQLRALSDEESKRVEKSIEDAKDIGS